MYLCRYFLLWLAPAQAPLWAYDKKPETFLTSNPWENFISNFLLKTPMKNFKRAIQKIPVAIAAIAALAPANLKAEELESGILSKSESVLKTGSAESVPKGVEVTGGYETFSLTRPEVPNRITVGGLNLGLELTNVSKSRFLAEGSLQYRFLTGKGGINGLETIVASLKPSFKIFGVWKKLEFELYAGSSVTYDRTATDSVQLNEVIGLMYSYATIFAAPRIKLITGLYDRLYNELAFEAGAAFMAGGGIPHSGRGI